MLFGSKIESQGRSCALFNLGGTMHPGEGSAQAYAASCNASDTAAGPTLQTLTFPVTPA